MNDAKLKLLVAEAVRLDREISKLSDELKEKKKYLAIEAELRADEATVTEGGGTSIIFEGADGCVCRVTKAGDTLKASIKDDDRTKAMNVSGKSFDQLFLVETVFMPVADFRDKAKSLLGRDAARLIKLCTNRGKLTVSFETKETQ